MQGADQKVGHAERDAVAGEAPGTVNATINIAPIAPKIAVLTGPSSSSGSTVLVSHA
jgi:hypothetical protein